MIPSTRIQYNGARVRIVGPRFAADDNIAVIEAGWQSIKRRLARGINADDNPLGPLNQAYARRKIREGARPIRDLRLTGALLDREIKVRYADDRQAIMDAGTQLGRIKARQNYYPLQFSESDQEAMQACAAEIFTRKTKAAFQVGYGSDSFQLSEVF